MASKKQLSDEVVAKALGWKWKPASSYGRSGFAWWNPRKKVWQVGIPVYTTSLDAIVAEIEARGLWWGVKAVRLMAPHRFYGQVGMKCAEKETAPLALCAALLAYLKEKP